MEIICTRDFYYIFLFRNLRRLDWRLNKHKLNKSQDILKRWTLYCLMFWKGCRFKLCNGWSTSSYHSEASHLPQFSLGGLSLWRYGHITVDLWWFVGEIQSFQNPCDRQFYLRAKKIIKNVKVGHEKFSLWPTSVFV